MHDRTALVTGGSRGIGRGIALALADAGASVAITYRRDAAAAEAVVARIEGAGGRAVAVQGDVARREDNEAAAAAARDALGPIDILVCNAGTASRGRSVADSDYDEFEHVLRVNALGGVRLAQLLLPDMRAAERGDIVFISSILAVRCDPNGAPYNMAKAAEEALARTLAKEERGNGVRVNVVAPGLVQTDMGDKLVRATAGVEDVAALAAVSPFGRVCTPEDIAAAVRFLVSDAGGYITGQRLGVDGGGNL